MLFACTSRNTAQWFGVGDDSETKQQVWHRRSLRHCSQRFGKLKVQYREPETATSFDQGLESPATHRMPKVLFFQSAGVGNLLFPPKEKTHKIPELWD